MNREHPIGVVVVGFGYWGPNLVRNFSQHDDVIVLGICDTDPARIKKATRLYPNIRTDQSLEDWLDDASVGVVAIATPVSTHFSLAKRSLEAGKHIFVEKPLTLNTSEGEQLIALAARLGLQVFVDHTFIFTPAVQKIKELHLADRLGSLLYYDSTRINLGLFQHDVDVVWDLAPHDISILDYLLDGILPVSVSCSGIAHVSKLADIAFLTLYYPDKFIAHINVNWMSPVKVRQVLVCGDKRMIVYDENTVQEKIRVYDRGVQIDNVEDAYSRLVQYREGDMYAPRLGNSEALALEVDNVVKTIRGNAKPMASGEAALRIVKILEAASESMRFQGRPVKLGDSTTIK